MNVIEADQLKNKLSRQTSLRLVNVLSEKYYQDCHIDGSINAPLDDLDGLSKSWGKDEEIIVYCASTQCLASKNAYEVLEANGFTNVAAYEGGMKEWHQRGYGSTGSCVLEYLSK